jgi:hypothetical protein
MVVRMGRRAWGSGRWRTRRLTHQTALLQPSPRYVCGVVGCRSLGDASGGRAGCLGGGAEHAPWCR